MKAQRTILTWLGRTGLVLTALILFSSSCATADIDRSELLTHKNWWNFYKRGVERLEKGNAAGALEDFETALGIRSGAKFGYAKDQWRVRTYGMHFLDQYFPNRELGVALFETGSAPEAIPYLEKSIDQTPSGRAKHFLNLARGKVISPNTALPQIRMDNMLPELTNEKHLPLLGTVAADAHVSDVIIQGRRAFIELAEKEYELDTRVTLNEGDNRVEIQVTDLLGRETTSSYSITLDRQPPTLAVHDIEELGAGKLRLTLKSHDPSGIASISFNSKTVFTASKDDAAKPRFSFKATVQKGAPALVEILDNAGNKMQASLDAGQLAALIQPTYMPLAQADGSAPVVPASTDQLRPALRLFSGKGPIMVFNEDFFLDGSAEDSGGLASISVNGENLLDSNDTGTRQTFFSRTLSLDEGTNTFTITASDKAGNSITRSIVVVQKEPEYLDEAHRLSVGVPPLPGEQSYAFQSRRLVEQEILDYPPRFRLLERDEGWDYILQEQSLSVSDLADPRSALKIGRLLPAEMLLMGDITTHGKGITVYLRIVEAGNGEVMFVEDVFCDDPNRNLAFQLAGLVMKVEQRFPLLEGNITEPGSKTVTVNLGKDDGARVGMQFVVTSGEDEERPLRRAGDNPIKLAIKRVKKNTSTAQIITDDADEVLQEGDYVYAR